MAERHLYNDNFEFEGSMDDDGNIYDERHWRIGRVEGDTIYDSSNIPRGHVNADGQVTDLCNIPTGKEFGSNFVGWGGHDSGLVRNDVLGAGRGNDYGIFAQVKDANRQYGMDDDDDDDDVSSDGGWDDFTSSPTPPVSRKSRQNGGGMHDGGCANDEIGCIFAVLVFLALCAFIYYGLFCQV